MVAVVSFVAGAFSFGTAATFTALGGGALYSAGPVIGECKFGACKSEAVAAGVRQCLHTYDREVLPRRVREITADPRGS